MTDYFNHTEADKFDKYTDTLLYLAARNEHVQNKIVPALKMKKVVICDRFVDSTYAYQVIGKKVKLSFIDNIQKVILGNLKPNITFLLKVSSASSKKRLMKRRVKNRYDKFSKSFYTKVQKSFLKIAKNKKNYFVLDSSKNDKNLENKIFRIISKKLGI